MATLTYQIRLAAVREFGPRTTVGTQNLGRGERFRIWQGAGSRASAARGGDDRAGQDTHLLYWPKRGDAGTSQESEACSGNARGAEAIPLLSECLAIREKTAPEDWSLSESSNSGSSCMPGTTDIIGKLSVRADFAIR